MDSPFSLDRAYSAIRRRKGTVLLVTLAVTAIMVAIAVTQPQVYDAETKLVVVTKSPESSSTEADAVLNSLQALRQGRTIETQVELVDNPDLLSAAYAELTSEEQQVGFKDRGFRLLMDNALAAIRRIVHPPRIHGPGGVTRPTPPAWSYDVKSKPDSDVIQIATHSYDPDLAAKLANAMANEYLKQDLARNRQATKAARRYVGEQMAKSHEELEAAAAALATSQKQTRLVAPADQATAISTTEVDIATQYATAESDARAARHRLSLLDGLVAGTNGTISSDSTIASDPEYQEVQAQIVQLEGQIAEQSQEFKPGSPEMGELQRELSDQQEKLRKLSRIDLQSKSSEANPVKIKLLEDYADAKSNDVVASAHFQALQRLLNRIHARIGALPSQARSVADRQLKVDILKSTYTTLSDRYNNLLIDEGSTVSNGDIAGAAAPPDEPSSKGMSLVAVGVVLGFILGCCAALVRDRRDTTIRELEDLEVLAGLPVLAAIPAAKSSSAKLITGEANPKYEFSEGFRLLRNVVNFSHSELPIRTLSITSPEMADGKSTVAANLALAEAKYGRRTLLVDADLRRPTVHDWFNVSNVGGLVAALNGTSALNEVVVSTSWENLFVLPAGSTPGIETDLLASSKLQGLLGEAAVKFDLVIIDGPPCAGVTDMQILSRYSDGVLLVVALDKSNSRALQKGLRLLRQAGAPLVGIVANRAKAGKSTEAYYVSDPYKDAKAPKPAPKSAGVV